MALSDKNIVITPNIGSSSDPKIVFSGADSSTSAQNITLNVYPTNNGTLSFEGSAGQLFSIGNTMSGTIYSVNDVSGIPSIEVLDTGLIKLGQYSGNILLGTGTDLGVKLQINGSTPSSVGALPSGVVTTQSSSGNNYLLFRNTADNGTYAGIAMQDNNIGGYVVFGNAGGGGDKMYIAGYGGIELQSGGADSISPSARTTLLNLTSSAVNSTVALQQGGNQVLHAGNYTSYSPSLTGGGASGTWGISITGSAGSLNGYTQNASSGANTIVQRDGNGYIQNNYFYTSGGGSERNASGMGYFAGFNTSDYYIRSYTNAAAASIIQSAASGTWSINVTGSAGEIGGYRSDGWLRKVNDNTQFQIYGNTRTIIYRTDGTTNPHGGGSYAHIFYYGGSGDADRKFIINTDGRLYSPYHGWLDTMSVSYASSAGSADNIDGWGFANTGSNNAVNANTLDQNGITYYTSGVDNFSGNSTDGALYSQYYSSSWQHQIAGDYREGNIAVRGKNNGTWARWKPVATITISDSAPANETRGDLWWQSSTGKLKIWYADVNSEQWVDAVPIPDTSTFFSKAGGAITGPVVINSSLTTTGNASVAGGFTLKQYNTQNLQIYSPASSGAVGISGHDAAGNWKYQLYGDGSNYGFLNGLWGGWNLRKAVSGDLYINENIALNASNYNSYSPTLTGGNASGTWSINITGSAGSVAWGNVSSRPTWMTSSSLIATHSNANDWQNSGFYENGGSGSNWPNGSGTWYNSINVRHSNQGNYHGFQLAMSYYDNYLYWRSYQGSGSFQTWARGLSDQNYNSYAPTLTGGGASGSWSITAAYATRASGNFYIDSNYGRGIVGVYSSYRYQGVFAMGDSYKLADDGTTTGSLYGMAWSHPNTGGVAGNLDSHGMIVMINGGFGSCMSYSIKASGNVTAYSDERLKTNWRDMPEDYVTGLAKVKVGIYDRTDGEQLTQVGVSAQSLQQILPEAIITADDDIKTLSVNYGGAALASAVELAKEVVDLRARVASLEALISKLIKE